MKTAVIAGGPGIDKDTVSAVVSSCDSVIAADSGAAVAIAIGIVPGKVTGDLDSLNPDMVEYLKNRGVEFEIFPVEKDMSDSELCLRSVPEDDEIIWICSLAGRPDHNIANLMLAIKLHEEGRSITLTDGVNDFIPLSGPDEISVSGILNSRNLAVSLIPFTEVKGVSSEGLYYKLDNTDLIPGSTLSISNRLSDSGDSFTVSIESGNLGVMIVRT